jgi:SRSO17 transposase
MATADCVCRDEVQVAEETSQVVDNAEQLLRPQCQRRSAYRHAVDYLEGLIAEVERKNGWQLAEQAGYAHPRGIQRVLDRYVWDADAVRDDLRRWVIQELGDPNGVLVVDETSFPKQGKHSAGVARQYCSTLGKVANCQVGVFLGYASPKGHAGIDRALFIPREWSADPQRCHQAGFAAGLPHRTKPQLALHMVERALDDGVPARWVVADEVYGSDGKLRRALEARDQSYVLAVRGNEKPSTWPPYGPPGQVAVSHLVDALCAEDWQHLSCGEGSQGPRVYDWAFVPIRPALRAGWVHAVLARRHPERTDEMAYYLVYAPVDMSLEEIVHAAESRWTIEEVFKQAKGQVGLDHYEVRSWQGWYRHITLALLALAALSIGMTKRGRPPVPAISPLPFLRSVGSSSVSYGRRPEDPKRYWRGHAGDATISSSQSNAIADVD